jgi:hypothetical protein
MRRISYEDFASGSDRGQSQLSSLEPELEQTTYCAPFVLRYPPSLSLRLPAFEVGYLLLMTKERFSFLYLEPELDFVPEASVPILYIFHAPPKSYSDQRPSSLRIDEVEQLLILFWRPPPFAFFACFHRCDHLLLLLSQRPTLASLGDSQGPSGGPRRDFANRKIRCRTYQLRPMKLDFSDCQTKVGDPFLSLVVWRTQRAF